MPGVQQKMFPYKIHAELLRGATQAFHEDRPENMQEIMSHADSFRTSAWKPGSYFAIETLIELINGSAKPGTVPRLALKRMPEDERQDILHGTLSELVF